MELVCKLGGIATHLSIRIWRLLWQPIGSPHPPEAAPNYCFFLQGEGEKKSIIATSVMCVVKQSKDLEPGGSTVWRTVSAIRPRGDRAAHVAISGGGGLWERAELGKGTVGLEAEQ